MHARRSHGFSVAEALIASAVLGILAVATLKGLSVTIAARQLNSDRARARMLCEDLLAEIASKAYADPSGTSNDLGLDGSEANGSSRLGFDDVDDFHALVESPPRAPDGAVLADVPAWTRTTTVEWILVTDLTAASDVETMLKRITVSVSRGGRTLGSIQALRSGAWSAAASVNTTHSPSAAVTAVSPR